MQVKGRERKLVARLDYHGDGTYAIWIDSESNPEFWVEVLFDVDDIKQAKGCAVGETIEEKADERR